MPDDNAFHSTDDYIGHIFDTSLNNSDKNNSINTIDVQKLYNKIDTFNNKNNYTYNDNSINNKNYMYCLKRYLVIIFLCMIFFLLTIYI